MPGWLHLVLPAVALLSREAFWNLLRDKCGCDGRANTGTEPRCVLTGLSQVFRILTHSVQGFLDTEGSTMFDDDEMSRLGYRGDLNDNIQVTAEGSGGVFRVDASPYRT